MKTYEINNYVTMYPKGGHNGLDHILWQSFYSDLLVALEQRSEDHKVIRIHPLGTMTITEIFQSGPYSHITGMSKNKCSGCVTLELDCSCTHSDIMFICFRAVQHMTK